MKKNALHDIFFQKTAFQGVEDAFFVLRAGRPSPAHADMIAEANRIVMGGRDYFLRGRRGRAVWLFFGAGVLVGTGIFFLLRFLIGF